MRLWDWAVAAYARPGVEPACLSLQDDHGQCVPLLLWRLWALAEGRGVDDGLLSDAVAAARAWEDEAIEPLRRIRRALKASRPPVPEASRAALRADVQAVELRAERLLLEALESLTPAVGGRPAGRAGALAALAAAWGAPAPGAALRALAVAAG